MRAESIVAEFELAARSFALVVMCDPSSSHYRVAKERRDCAYMNLMAHIQRLELQSVNREVRALKSKTSIRRNTRG